MFSKIQGCLLITSLVGSLCVAEVGGPTPIHLRQPGHDFLVPSRLLDLLLKDPDAAKEVPASEAEKKEEGGGEKKEEGQAKPSAGNSQFQVSTFLYAPLEIILKEKTPGTLKQPELHLVLPDGGGEVDLADWVTPRTGSFYVKFSWAGLEGESSQTKVYFYSRTKKRRVGDQIIGSGCQKFLDLSNYFVSENKKEGIVVNSTKNFHTSVLGGHFLFSWLNGGVRKVTQVSFIDSHNPTYFCETAK